MNPLVSIVTPCYNGENFLDAYFHGVLSQKHQNIELIFVDDGSTDHTAQIAREYGETLIQSGMKFVYIYQENSGIARAINQGLSQFSGDYFTWLDSDDILLPENISKKLEALNRDQECGFAMSGIQLVDSSDPECVLGTRIQEKPAGEDTLFENYIFARNTIWGPGTVLVRREALLKAIPSRQIYVSREGQNWQLMLPLSYLYRCAYVQEPLLSCVVHSDSHSRTKRSFQDEVQREKGFIIICSETVKNIPGMTEEEKKHWIHEIISFHHHNIMNMAAKAHNADVYNESRETLASIGEEKTIRNSYATAVIRQYYAQIRHP